MNVLKTTPFHSRTAALMQGEQWRRWGGHVVASAYELTHDREYLAIRNACAFIDVSPLCKYLIRGPEARAYLNRLVTRDLSKLGVGQMAYTPWCNSRGQVIDDGTVACFGEDLFRLTSAETNYHWLLTNAEDFEVTIKDVSDELGTVAVQGPRSRDLLADLLGASIRNLPFYGWTAASFQGAELTVSRTGYTGDLGYEVWVPADKAETFWDALIVEGRRHAAQPAGIWALDVARIEAGLIMLGVDYNAANHALAECQASSPYEIGLGWAVHLKKGPFVGRKALQAEKQRGSALKLVGLELDHQTLTRHYEALGMPVQFPFVPWREVVPVFSPQRQVGTMTCGTWSPTCKKYLALAQIHPEDAGESLHVRMMVDRHQHEIAAKSVPLPFFNPERKRA
jgi:aminomethyltransferase